MKMLTVLLATWLVLAQGEDGAQRPPPPPSDDLSQIEITPEEIPLGFPEQEEFPEQREIDLPLLFRGEPRTIGVFSPRGRKPNCTGIFPCSRRPSLYKLDEFPPGRPTLGNLGNICAAGRKKISYGPWNLPQTSYSHLVRQGDALNSLETELGRCCHLPQNEKLPCSVRVWSDILGQFCTAELSAKTKPYYCCKLKGDTRQRCFQDAAPFPNYKFKGAAGGANPAGPQKLPELSFPPGRPSSANIGNVCTLRKFRPVYPASVLPRSGYGWFQRQARAVNRMENAFKKCCRTQDVGCARRGWEKSLTQFCKEEFSVKTRQHPCCKLDKTEDRHDCFAVQAPYPDYDKEVQLASLAEVTPSLLDTLCGQVTLLTKQKHIPALVKNITGPCCSLLGEERTQCATEAKSEFITTLCGARRRSWKDPENCCAQTEEGARHNCFNLKYLTSVPLARAGQPLQPTLPAK
ncbi:extracellular matrix protein 1 isoform X1 [Tiliqua scincoides]|uniref:extracellular matrix protein 1 isoform X1 n=1 Tax=Tiliqua scincoides TaxID=71010 RepID=UPI00346356E9